MKFKIHNQNQTRGREKLTVNINTYAHLQKELQILQNKWQNPEGPNIQEVTPYSESKTWGAWRLQKHPGVPLNLSKGRESRAECGTTQTKEEMGAVVVLQVEVLAAEEKYMLTHHTEIL